MENNKVINPRKIIVVAISFVVFIILLEWLWHYFHTGKIVISSNSPQNSIVLTSVNSDNVGGASDKTIKAKGQLSVSVGLGHYVASVSNGQKAETQSITLGSNKTKSYYMALNNTLQPEPVINTSSQDIALSNNSLAYLNTDTNSVNTIDENNNLSTLNSSYQLQTIKWANANFGVGQDTQQNLYLINNGSISPLSLPSSSNNIQYSVASNQQIYVSIGSNVYIGSSNDNFNKIYTSPSPPLVVGGSNNKVAIAYSAGKEDGGDDSDVTVAVVNTSGQVAKANPGQDVSSLIWSPSGNYLASLDESSIDIYSLSLHSVVIIPTTYPAGYLSWLNNNKFVYADQGKLWTYDLSTGRANLIANMPLDTLITGLAISEDGAYAYVSSENTAVSGNSAILRVGLAGQQAPTIVYQLQVLLPMTLNNYTMSLVNFATPPTILVVPSSPASSANQNAYIAQAQTAIQQDGFNTSQLRFNFSEPN